jgi:septal ring factor EnvC (AmiA/AmiB activator)
MINSLLDLFFPRLLLRVSALERKVISMSAELDALKAAVAADADADAKLVSYLGTLKTQLDGVTAQLTALQAQAVINPADIQAIADQLSAHAASVAANIPSA